MTPAQSSLEAPYIQRNIEATRAAYGLTNNSIIQTISTQNVDNPAGIIATYGAG